MTDDRENVIEGAFPPRVDQGGAQGIAAPPARSGAAYLTREQLAQLDDEMTMGDTWRATDAARDAFPDDPERAKRHAGMLAFLFVARRIGMVDTSTELEPFLDRVRQDDFLSIMAPDVREGKSAGS